MPLHVILWPSLRKVPTSAAPAATRILNTCLNPVLRFSLSCLSSRSRPEVHGDDAAYEAGPTVAHSMMAVVLDSSDSILWIEVMIPPSYILPLRFGDPCSGKYPQAIRTGWR